MMKFSYSIMLFCILQLIISINIKGQSILKSKDTFIKYPLPHFEYKKVIQAKNGEYFTLRELDRKYIKTKGDSIIIFRDGFNLNNELSSDGKSNIYLANEDIYGNTKWIKFIDERQNPLITANRSAILPGTKRYDGLITVFIQTSDNGFIIAYPGRILKLDNKGNVQWKIDLYSTNFPGLNKMDSDAFYSLDKLTIKSIVETDGGSHVGIIEEFFSIFKINKNGKPLWIKPLLFNKFSQCIFYTNSDKITSSSDSNSYRIRLEPLGSISSAIVQSNTRNFYILTRSSFSEEPKLKIKKELYGRKFFIDKNQFIDESQLPDTCYEISTDNSYLRTGSALLIKTDSLGNVIWRKKFENAINQNYANVGIVFPINDGGCILGFQDSDFEKTYNGRYYKLGNAYVRILRLDSGGNIIWDNGPKKYFASNGFPAYGKITTDSTFILSGYVEQSDPAYSDGSYTWIAKFNINNGDLIWKIEPVMRGNLSFSITDDGGCVFTTWNELVKIDKDLNLPSNQNRYTVKVLSTVKDSLGKVEIVFEGSGLIPDFFLTRKSKKVIKSDTIYYKWDYLSRPSLWYPPNKKEYVRKITPVYGQDYLVIQNIDTTFKTHCIRGNIINYYRKIIIDGLPKGHYKCGSDAIRETYDVFNKGSERGPGYHYTSRENPWIPGTLVFFEIK